MGLFDRFKKKKEDIKLDYSLFEMKKGFVLDYFLKTWEVKKVDIYDWGNGETSREYLIDSGDDAQFLHVEPGTPLKCTLSKTLELREIDPLLASSIVKADDAPQQLVYQNETYHKVSSAQGYCGEEGSPEEDWSKFVNWTYDCGEKFISVDRWDEEEFSAAYGCYVKPFEFSDILPR
ncbi:MAG: DUF4178 domain-containing protein [Salibacteraceae bacterium]